MSTHKKSNNIAPGAPGCPPSWTTGAKTAIGTSPSPSSSVWFSISQGILNEIFYPQVDNACTRDMGLVVTDGREFFSEEKNATEHQVEYIEEGVPAIRIINTCKEGRYKIEKEIITDPVRDALLQRIRFTTLKGDIQDYHVYVLLNPAISNSGFRNDAWVDDLNSHRLLFARRNDVALALACSIPWKRRSVGYECVSDGWQDLHRHKRMMWEYHRANKGNVAMLAELDLEQVGNEWITVSLGFGRNAPEAGQRAISGLIQGFDYCLKKYIGAWQEYQGKLQCIEGVTERSGGLSRTSAMVLKTLQSKRFPGGMIASLAIPWGFSKGSHPKDHDSYHLVWPRDAVEMAVGLLAIDAVEDARAVLDYLMVTQMPEGRWPQNMWLDGTPYWTGIQMDEVAFPILLADYIRRQAKLEPEECSHAWPMIQKAASFLLRHGPATPQDRWEEQKGYTAFTLGAEIAALLAAADFADMYHEEQVAQYLRETADAWNESIEHWTYVKGTELAAQEGVEGYYVRVMPADIAARAHHEGDYLPADKLKDDEHTRFFLNMVSIDALALVRFGLRKADDPRILNTIRLIDRLTKTETEKGPIWHRYNGDVYGEYDDGNPYNGGGKGRPWPLLIGERAHYELAAGNMEEAKRLLEAIENYADVAGMIPEQIWNAPDIPEKQLYTGGPTGSAMPLGWAHAEYLKLVRSIKEGKVFDMPPQTRERYAGQGVKSQFAVWRFQHKIKSVAHGKILRIETMHPAKIRWTTDSWKSTLEMSTADTGLGIHHAELPTHDLPKGKKLTFTFYWISSDTWENHNFTVVIK